MRGGREGDKGPTVRREEVNHGTVRGCHRRPYREAPHSQRLAGQ
jgi:hypothetical protein